MEHVTAIILGILEGITEFLPVSSTGHLLIAEKWLTRQSDLFNVVIQAGAVLAVTALFAKKIFLLLKNWRSAESQNILLKLGTAFVLTLAGGYLLQKFGFQLPESVVPVALATLLGGIAILIIEYFVNKKPATRELTWTLAIFLGVAQLAAAIFPGLSRSGATILLALAWGVKRPQATEYSFLLGIPTLFAAAAVKTWSAVQHGESENWMLLLLATATSAITAFLVVKWLLRYIQTHDFRIFGWYRVILGAILLLFWR